MAHSRPQERLQMTGNELIDLFAKAGKRSFVIGDTRFGVLISPDLEGRNYLLFEDTLLSRVNPDAVIGHSDAKTYFNPGGDGLWAAPEGTKFGYNYATGSWSVSTGLLRARFEVVEQSKEHLVIAGDVPLINASGVGVQTEFRREIALDQGGKLRRKDSIRYTGDVSVAPGSVMLAAWSLCQFDWQDGDRCELLGGTLRDLYGASSAYRSNGCCKPTRDMRYQVAAGPECDGITLNLTRHGITIRREAEAPAGTDHIDIADLPPSASPCSEGVKYSFYNDPSGFLEIEAVGNGLRQLNSGDLSELIVTDTVEKHYC